MNQDQPESRDDTCFVAPDTSSLFDQSRELRIRTRIIIRDMKRISRRIERAMKQSETIVKNKPPLPDKFR
jgi:hypothetical protein